MVEKNGSGIKKKRMKNIFLIACLLLSASAQAQQGKIKTAPTNVSGVMTPMPQKGYFLLQHHGQMDTVKVANDGTFKMAIQQNEAGYYNIVSGKQSIGLYLLPLDNFKMTLNANMLANNPKFEGNSAVYCNYLATQKANDNTNAFFGKMSTMNPDAFMQQMDSTKKIMTTLLEVESAKHKFITPFVASERSALDYAQANAYLLYKYQKEEAKVNDLPAQIAERAMTGDLNNETMRFHDQFLNYATNLINYKANVKYDAEANQTYTRYCELKVDEVCATVKSQVNRDVIFQNVMNQILQEAGTQDIRKAVAKFENCCTDEKLKTRIRRVMAQYTSIYPGELAPDAVCFDSTGKTMHLSDFRGKVIYIDTWATWCGPCKREIPELKKLEAEYHGKNVEFISISTDQNVGTWKSFIAKQEMSGLQLHQSEKMEESVSKLYMVNSIPRFIVIDEEGKIVSSDAPRPSSGTQVRDMLNTELAD